MSSFEATFRNKMTGETEKVFCYDDFFGRHEYGYRLESGYVLTEEEMFNKYERVRNETILS